MDCAGAADRVLIFTIALLYLVIPSRRVRFSDALWGAALAGTLIWLMRWAFGLYVSYLPFYETLYGAISAVPILLVWTYVSWTVVLVGATVAAVLTERRDARAAISEPKPRTDVLA
ncbi:MAG: YihY family inner membrane protein [Rhodospirillales bacterium]|nr:YihY family inner membrane protein [Rhodospirillales bacterium]